MTKSDVNHESPYIGRDLGGFPMNREFQPDLASNGSHFSGYANAAEEVFFYDYAVQGYGVTFSYQGKDYLIAEDDPCTLIDVATNHQEVFDSPIALIKGVCIDGTPLLQLIQKGLLKNVDVQ